MQFLENLSYLELVLLSASVLCFSSLFYFFNVFTKENIKIDSLEDLVSFNFKYLKNLNDSIINSDLESMMDIFHSYNFFFFLKSFSSLTQIKDFLFELDDITQIEAFRLFLSYLNDDISFEMYKKLLESGKIRYSTLISFYKIFLKKFVYCL